MPRDEIVGLTPPFPWWEQDEELDAASSPARAFERVYRLPDGTAAAGAGLASTPSPATTASPRSCSR